MNIENIIIQVVLNTINCIAFFIWGYSTARKKYRGVENENSNK
jgi:hypothetical protein